jgi:methionine-gamma-lyase
MHERERGFSTRAVHGAEGAEPVRQEPATTPIYQSALFSFTDIEEFAAVGKAKISGGYLYSRWANPTTDALARLVADLEGAEEAACFASGMGAIHGVLASLVRAGDHIVAARQLYGGTFSLLTHILPRGGIETTFVDIADPAAVDQAFAPRTKVLYCETIGNPTLTVADLDALAAVARDHEATFVVDATFTTPYLLTALSHGAHVSIHSATKYLGGHSDVTAGVVAGGAEGIAAVRMLGIDYGGVLAPFEAWLTARGIQTLALRMDRICSSAQTIAEFLESRRSVDQVWYPGLASHPQHELARRLLPRGCGGMVAFDVSGGVPAGRRVLERIRVAKAAASLGGTKTLLVHPASVTHTQLGPEERARAGITDGLMRLSVGLEDAEDLIADLDEALG